MAAIRQEKRTLKWHRKEYEYYRLRAIEETEAEIKVLRSRLIDCDDKIERLKLVLRYQSAWHRRLDLERPF